MADKTNPLVFKSQKWLTDALLSLMKQKAFSAITVKEIAEKAELDRRTFYRHFNSKEELLDLYVEKLFKEYVSILSRESDQTIDSVALIYFEFWEAHLDFLCIVSQNDLQAFLLSKFNEYMPRIYTALQLKMPVSAHTDQGRYALAFKTGGFWNILFEWVNNGARQKPSEMAVIVTQMVRNNLFG